MIRNDASCGKEMAMPSLVSRIWCVNKSMSLNKNTMEYQLDEEERICNLMADSISPRLVPNIEMVTVDGKTL